MECYLKTFRGHGDSVNALTVLPNCNLVSGSQDKTLKIWNTTTCLNTFQTDYLCYGTGCFTNLTSGTWDPRIEIRNSNTGDCLKKATWAQQLG